jgi:hypothetical protein
LAKIVLLAKSKRFDRAATFVNQAFHGNQYIAPVAKWQLGCIEG